MQFFNKVMRKLIYNRSDATRRRLVLRNWGGVSDINLISDALTTETFRSFIKPQKTEIEKSQTLLVLAPHQDDEIIGAGGLLLRARSHEARSSICFITNGAQNNIVFDDKKLSPETVVDLRKKEATRICDSLGANYLELGVDNIAMNITQVHVDALGGMINKINPDIILTPWIFDGSAKHRAVNHLLYLALQTTSDLTQPEIWGYQVNNPIYCNIVVDITDEIKEKINLMEIYETQNIGIKNYAHLAEGLSAWNSRFLPSKVARGEKQYAELFMTTSCHDYCQMIENYYLKNLEQVYYGDSKLINTMTHL